MLAGVSTLLTELSVSTELHFKLSPGFKENRFWVRVCYKRWSKRDDGARPRREERAALVRWKRQGPGHRLGDSAEGVRQAARMMSRFESQMSEQHWPVKRGK